MLTRFPWNFSKAIVARAKAASEQIRHERLLAFGHPVVVSTGDYKLVFAPLDGSEGRVELPFRFLENDSSTEGVVYLSSPRTPLAVGFSVPRRKDLLFIWASALSAFAELTCPEAGLATIRSKSTSHGSSTSRYRPRPVPPRQPRPSQSGAVRLGGVRLSSRLTPDGATACIAATYVAGHRRRLLDGQKASSSARKAALQVGIELRGGETWVRPFVRGMPSDTQLFFHWAAPPELRTPVVVEAP